MTSTAHTGPARGPAAGRRMAPATSGSQWWKVWLLLTSLGATTLGSMAFPQEDPPLVNSAGSTREPAHVEQVRVMAVRTIESPGPVVGSPAPVPALRAMPQRPVFRTPVTRTRRS